MMIMMMMMMISRSTSIGIMIINAMLMMMMMMMFIIVVLCAARQLIQPTAKVVDPDPRILSPESYCSCSSSNFIFVCFCYSKTGRVSHYCPSLSLVAPSRYFMVLPKEIDF
ncbi:GM13148 [Drosophila sechellia]|uniref:GM13148 n=1 Tax=Drosophila sechellia TaxID=7238 RepID=B4IL06_DROSE|nr:GM13148 [Drosophila sechellia]